MTDIQELKKRISTTNEAGLIAILFEKLIENSKNCISAIKDEDYDQIIELNNNSRAILTELTVQFSGNDEISSTLREINIYINKTITEGEIKKDPSLFETNIKILRPILEGFKELEIKEKPKAVTGLTYGKDNLGEYTLGENRSFQG
ncbi:putative Flagellar protein FliS [[Clostridium] ultunense Esp]|uniref:Putative Flagellar protein FliS n=1 Tax=[Clostridium] ultunense Esp TaxID=1288971 RepID=M1Z582_9FIRM|nr:flagellar protein FliS [Schnuerera ultunensis]CCQ98045.1 putative Flagellar protein FliS [[Clostridium] ultunense Esp]SHD76093.1 putative Flagellar protein FliS [[Clostridium] ultunense Esp]